MLCESVRIVPVKYGLNYPSFDDFKSVPSKIMSFTTSLSTIFKIQNYAFVIDMMPLELPTYIMRAASEEIDRVGIHSTEDILKHSSVTRRARARHMPYVEVVATFSSAISIAINLSRSKNIDKFQFTGLDEPLTRFYDIMIKNKTFVSSVTDAGWIIDKKGDKYVFTRTIPENSTEL